MRVQPSVGTGGLIAERLFPVIGPTMMQLTLSENRQPAPRGLGLCVCSMTATRRGLAANDSPGSALEYLTECHVFVDARRGRPASTSGSILMESYLLETLSVL